MYKKVEVKESLPINKKKKKKTLITFICLNKCLLLQTYNMFN